MVWDLSKVSVVCFLNYCQENNGPDIWSDTPIPIWSTWMIKNIHKSIIMTFYSEQGPGHSGWSIRRTYDQKLCVQAIPLSFHFSIPTYFFPCRWKRSICKHCGKVKETHLCRSSKYNKNSIKILVQILKKETWALWPVILELLVLTLSLPS